MERTLLLYRCGGRLSDGARRFRSSPSLLSFLLVALLAMSCCEPRAAERDNEAPSRAVLEAERDTASMSETGQEEMEPAVAPAAQLQAVARERPAQDEAESESHGEAEELGESLAARQAQQGAAAAAVAVDSHAQARATIRAAEDRAAAAAAAAAAASREKFKEKAHGKEAAGDKEQLKNDDVEAVQQNRDSADREQYPGSFQTRQEVAQKAEKIVTVVSGVGVTARDAEEKAAAVDKKLKFYDKKLGQLATSLKSVHETADSFASTIKKKILKNEALRVKMFDDNQYKDEGESGSGAGSGGDDEFTD
eukprot:TRINITY_DN1605_c0_g1_i1.p1 TRINITY_DN1605_c0_g1~~TRINITY_DN1605_c0_g1_i1.p1  ORF type:complete len:308 (-),score=104.26 TRINITY_DN1605_c0_g1_i1:75-998(-)